jgi:ABC-type sugar transport system substrate-binding protein
MGYLGVTKMLEHLNGTKPEPKIDSGAVFVDKTNIDSEEVKALLPK